MTNQAVEAELSGVATSVLELKNVTAGYGKFVALRDVTLSVPAGQVVALLGSNGAGKTTLLRTASGLIRPMSGDVLINGEKATRLAPNKRARAGICLIPEGRGIFRSLTIRENLRLGIPPWSKSADLDQVLGAFPVLAKRLGQSAGSLSGGEQQMVALARAYLSSPTVVLLDEVSMGLAPKVVDQIFDSLRELAKSGVAMLLVEQYVNRALEMADQVVMLDRGSIAFTGTPEDLAKDDLLTKYFGLDAAPPAPASY